ncbi:alpha/beta hydrolase fold domain-containing protein [Pontibacter sp. G13]|uniref:alpha/beta hydrolase fold domain-containing protein n=1 Tax=Pontibacter sp. G13 TaxID=3074898 RepID=UPI00288B8A83|nr:alpha/beta hydrolase fold domain-containing protein [Pontibacter sp. G13]WNJ21467.1 alpha/beta hydrolase fold domain-containing protein [Pontibacter sp. G13]
MPNSFFRILIASLLCSLGFIAQPAYSQVCSSGTFSSSQYSIAKDSQLVYGQSIGYLGNQDTLALDVYYPTDDTLCLRPLIVLMHGGGFYSGSRQDPGITALCEEFASHGIVAAAIDYRLGFFTEPLPYSCNSKGDNFSYDTHELPRAVFRAIQDARGAIRWLKSQSQTYQIDTSNVFIGGESAGAVAAVHVAYMDKSSERPSSANAQFKAFALDNAGDTICSAPRPNLGSMFGSLNTGAHTSKVRGVVNIYGAIIDTSWIESPMDPGIFQLHIKDDPVISRFCNIPYHGFPSPPANNPIICGAEIIQQRLAHLGMDTLKTETHILQGNLTGPPPNPHSLNGIRPLVVDQVSEFIDGMVCRGCKPPLQAQVQDYWLCPNDTLILAPNESGLKQACTQYRWLKDGQVVGLQKRLRVTHPATEEPNGFYQYVVIQPCGQDTIDAGNVLWRELPTIDHVADTIQAFVGDSVLLTVFTTGDSLDFSWKFQGVEVGDEDSFLISPIQTSDSGAYYVQVSNQCGSTENTYVTLLQVITQSNGIPQPIQSLEIYPVPTEDALTVRWNTQAHQGTMSLTLFGLDGKKIWESEITSGLPIRIPERLEGLFILRIGNQQVEHLQVHPIRTR